MSPNDNWIPGQWEREYAARETLYPSRAPSTGSISTLAMSEDDAQQVKGKPHRRPGFGEWEEQEEAPRAGLMRFTRP